MKEIVSVVADSYLDQIEALTSRLHDAQRAISALVHHVQDRPHGISELGVVRAIDDAIEAYPAATWQEAA